MQANTNEITQFLIAISYSSPFLLVYSVGILLSFLFRRRLGWAWLISLGGFLLLLAGSLIHIGYIFWLFFLRDSGSGGTDMFQTVAAVSSISQTVIGIIGMIFLMVAIFSKRPLSPSE